MYDSEDLMLWTASPIPPAFFEMTAHYLRVSNIPSIESSFIVNKKHELIYGFGVPELNKVGVAWVNQHSDIRSYVSKADSRSSRWIPREHLISMC
jgi:hypothetical protein